MLNRIRNTEAENDNHYLYFESGFEKLDNDEANISVLICERPFGFAFH